MVVDSNVVLDIVSNDPKWFDWSISQLQAADMLGPLVINDVIYAEISSRYERIELVDELVAGMRLRRDRIPKGALFLAGRAFKLYRDRGGVRGKVLSDFLIGAHALVAGEQLLTRDPGHFRTYFPTVELITP